MSDAKKQVRPECVLCDQPVDPEEAEHCPSCDGAYHRDTCGGDDGDAGEKVCRLCQLGYAPGELHEEVQK